MQIGMNLTARHSGHHRPDLVEAHLPRRCVTQTAVEGEIFEYLTDDDDVTAHRDLVKAVVPRKRLPVQEPATARRTTRTDRWALNVLPGSDRCAANCSSSAVR